MGRLWKESGHSGCGLSPTERAHAAALHGFSSLIDAAAGGRKGNGRMKRELRVHHVSLRHAVITIDQSGKIAQLEEPISSHVSVRSPETCRTMTPKTISVSSGAVEKHL